MPGLKRETGESAAFAQLLRRMGTRPESYARLHCMTARPSHSQLFWVIGCLITGWMVWPGVGCVPISVFWRGESSFGGEHLRDRDFLLVSRKIREFLKRFPRRCSSTSGEYAAQILNELVLLRRRCAGYTSWIRCEHKLHQEIRRNYRMVQYEYKFPFLFCQCFILAPFALEYILISTNKRNL